MWTFDYVERRLLTGKLTFSWLTHVRCVSSWSTRNYIEPIRCNCRCHIWRDAMLLCCPRPVCAYSASGRHPQRLTSRSIVILRWSAPAGLNCEGMQCIVIRDRALCLTCSRMRSHDVDYGCALRCLNRPFLPELICAGHRMPLHRSLQLEHGVTTVSSRHAPRSALC